VNGHFNNVLGSLNSQGLVVYPAPGLVELTDAGMAVASVPEAAPTREDLIERVVSILRDEPRRRVFRSLIAAGDQVSRDELAAASGYTVNGHFNNVLGSLNSLGVAEYPAPGMVRLGMMFNAL
jgi:hypothetical protein